jgi:hypothetical protein
MSGNVTVINGGEAEKVAFMADVEQIIVENWIPVDSKHLFTPLVFGLSQILVGGPNGIVVGGLPPVIDPLVYSICPTYKTENNFRIWFFNYLKAKDNLETLHKAFALSTSSKVTTQKHLVIMVKVDLANAEIKTWQQVVAKFDYSIGHILAIQQAPAPGERNFMWAVILMVIYRVVQLCFPLGQGAGGVGANPTVPVPTGPPRTIEDLWALLLPKVNQIDQMSERLSAVETHNGRTHRNPVAPVRTSTITAGLDSTVDDELQDDEIGNIVRDGMREMMEGAGKESGADVSAGVGNHGSGSSGTAVGNKRTLSADPEVQIVEQSGRFNGPSKKTPSSRGLVSGKWWDDKCSKLMNFVNYMYNVYQSETHRKAEDLREDMYDKPGAGLDFIDPQGVPLRCHVPAYKKHDRLEPKLKCEILNPDDHGDLTSFGTLKNSCYIFPCTIWHFDAFIRSAIQKLLECTCVGYKQQTANEQVQCVMDYQELFMEFAETKVAPRTEFHRHPHHITCWAQLATLHVNLWNRAVLNRDLSLLVVNFRLIAESQYAHKLTPKSGGESKLHLRIALELLEYRCPSCSRPGACNAICKACNVDLFKRSSEKGKPEGWRVAFDAWKKKNGGKEKFQNRGFDSVYRDFVADGNSKFALVEVKGPVGDDYIELSKHQHLIAMHNFEGRRMYC